MRARGLVAALCLAPLLAGCLGVPDEGPVVEAQRQADPNEELGYYNDPPPPGEGDPPAEIVQGFLDAQTAIPVQTNTAEQYLTRAAAAAWRPQLGTVTYAEASLPEGSNRVSVELSGANRLDGAGSWRGPVPSEEQVLSFTMQREEGEWRIADLPDVRVVPETWFDQAFRRVSLYFFDPTARILVPEPVFLPRGDQLATALVDRLIRGPSGALRGSVEQSFVPRDVDIELSVTRSARGIADVRLSGPVSTPGERDAALMVSQLTTTLAQDSTLRGIRVSINGEPVLLSDEQPVFEMDRGRYYDPTGVQSTSQLFALREGRLVVGPAQELLPATGPMGERDLGVTTIGVDLRGTRVAGVTGDGRRLLVTDVRDPDARVTRLVTDGTDLQAPVWDYADRMWILDRTPDGAALSVASQDRVRDLRIPGVSGRPVSRLLVSRDGSRLVAVIDGGADDRIVISRLRYGAGGRLLGGSRAREVVWQDESRVSVIDVGWSSPTSLAVLHRLGGDLVQLETFPVDGAPAGVLAPSVTLQDPVRGVVASVRETDPLFAHVPDGLVDVLSGSETPVSGSEGITSPTYVG